MAAALPAHAEDPVILTSEDGESLGGLQYGFFVGCAQLRALIDENRHRMPAMVVGVEGRCTQTDTPRRCMMTARHLVCITQFYQLGVLNVQDWTCADLMQLALLAAKYDGHYCNQSSAPRPTLLSAVCQAMDHAIQQLSDQQLAYVVDAPPEARFTPREQDAVDQTLEWTRYQTPNISADQE